MIGAGLRVKSNVLPFNVDADAYLLKIASPSIKEEQAVNNLFKSFIDNSMLSLIYSMYLFSPKNLSASLVDAINPGVNDLTAVNTVSHSVQGLETNGVNSYLISGLDPTSVSVVISNFGNTIYHANAGQKSFDMGVDDVTIDHSTATNISGNFVAAFPTPLISVANETKVVTIQKDASNMRYFSDGNLIKTEANSSTTALSSFKSFIGALNNSGVASLFSQRPYKTVLEHKNLTIPQALIMKNIIETYNQSLETPR